MKTRELEIALIKAMSGRIAHDDELGIEHGLGPQGGTLARMPSMPALGDGSGFVALGALATLLDTACGVGAMASLEFRETVATIDLRIDYLRPMPLEGDITATARPLHIAGKVKTGSVLMQAEVRSNNCHEPVAQAVGRFFRRPMPKQMGVFNPAQPLLRSNAKRYDALTDFQTPGGNQTILPFRAGLIGNGSVPSLHGGVIGSLIQKSAFDFIARSYDRSQELSSVTINYLRFGRPADLIATAAPVRLGRNTATVDVSVHQGGDPGRLVAKGIVTFIRADRNATATVT